MGNSPRRVNRLSLVGVRWLKVVNTTTVTVGTYQILEGDNESRGLVPSGGVFQTWTPVPLSFDLDIHCQIHIVYPTPIDPKVRGTPNRLTLIKYLRPRIPERDQQTIIIESMNHRVSHCRVVLLINPTYELTSSFPWLTGCQSRGSDPILSQGFLFICFLYLYNFPRCFLLDLTGIDVLICRILSVYL